MRTHVLLATSAAMAIAAACVAQTPPASPASAPATVKEPKLVSSKPIYLSVVFGENTDKKMLIVIDESKGDGTGYDSAYVDENMDGDLTKRPAGKFPQYQVEDKKRTDPRIHFTGPLPGKTDAKASYELNLYSLGMASSKTAAQKASYFFWSVTDADKADFFFINGKFHMYSSAADALAGQPIVLASKCKWAVTSRQNGQNAALGVTLKDINGCSLRTARNASGVLAPVVTVTAGEGKELLKDKTLEYG